MLTGIRALEDYHHNISVGLRNTNNAHRGSEGTVGPKAGIVGTVYQEGVMRTKALGQCHASRPHPPLAARARRQL
jgi:hypothetical protein